MQTLRPAISMLLLLAANSVAAAERQPDSQTGSEFFEKRIRPLLAENCYQCHGAKRQRGGLMLDNVVGILKGGDRGPIIAPGKPDHSLLVRAIGYADEKLRMPPRGKLKDEQIADLVAWVKMGAPLPANDAVSQTGVSPSSVFDLAERRKHWAYQPAVGANIPAVSNAAWCNSPVDFFILARLEAAGLAPTPPADRRTLIRRVTFDLTGFPPTPEEVEAFLSDDSPTAVERLVDRLLASPQYGERWGRHWLDLVRFAETLAFEFDYDLFNAWRYRDYVIAAFNEDLPYDRFVVEHLAGDLIPEPRRDPLAGVNQSILATGYYWMGEGKQTPVDIRQEQADRIDNQIDVLGKAFLAQTIACARCHDHKFDAISTRDYYALVGYLKSSRYQQAFIDPVGEIAVKAERLSEIKAKTERLIVSELVPAWQEQLALASRYLLASQQVKAAATERRARSLEEWAAEFGLDAARLDRWVKALRMLNAVGSEHPMYAWIRLVDQIAESPFREQRNVLRDELLERAVHANQAAKSTHPFQDFRSPNYDGWFATGDAFGARPARTGDLILGDPSGRPVQKFLSGGAHSGLLSSRLQGELRSQTFTIHSRYVHFRLSGRDARVNLVIDGNTLIMNPIYGKLTAKLEDRSTWQSVPVDRWIGHRAYIEICDSSVPMHGLNPPPSTARVPEGPKDGYAVLEQIVFSDEAEPPPSPPNRINLDALDSARDDHPQSLAVAYQQLMILQINRWQSGEFATSPQNNDGIVLLNWLLQNGLLDGDGESARDAPPSSRRTGTLPVLQGNERVSRIADLLRQYRQIEATIPSPRRAPALADGTGEDESIYLRGNYQTLGKTAPRGLPEVLATSGPTNSASGSGRLELAHRLVDPTNPLVARVLVNRIWLHHFGEGIVRTPDDFGRMGQPPTHPELLNYLAGELISSGWSVKHMHRQMVLSSTYRQASSDRGLESAGSPAPRQETALSTTDVRSSPSTDRNPFDIDPENRLLHHMPVRRLEAEAIRDAILAISGRLNRTMYGASVLPYLTPHMEGRGRPNPGPLDGDGRRSIYLNARRNFLTPMLLAFDYPVSFSTIGRRGASTVPAQALTLMNDPFVVQQAGVWANRLLAEPAQDSDQRICRLYETAFARSPTATELADARAFVERQASRHGGGLVDPRPWTDLCHVLINVKEFIFIE